MNVYTELATRLVSTLTDGLVAVGYTDLQVRKGIWDPRKIEPFGRYLVFVAPPLQDPWRESRHQASKLVNYTLRADVYLLVKNFDEDASIYGDTAPDQGVWQLMSDVRDVLRNTDLDGLVERTYRETEGGSAFETGATGGFDTGSHGFVHRARLTYTAQMFPFCHPA